MRTKKEIQERVDQLRQVRDNFQWEVECPDGERQYPYLSRQCCRSYAHELQQLILELKWVLQPAGMEYQCSGIMRAVLLTKKGNVTDKN